MNPWIQKEINKVTSAKAEAKASPVTVSTNLEENIIYFKEKLGESFDILYKQTYIGNNKAVLIMDDGTNFRRGLLL